MTATALTLSAAMVRATLVIEYFDSSQKCWDVKYVDLAGLSDDLDYIRERYTCVHVEIW